MRGFPFEEMSKDQIIVGLGGRLGNQMFQYAAGKALALRVGAALAFEGYGTGSAKKSRVQIFESFGLADPFTAVTSRRLDKIRVKLSRLGLPIRMRGLPIYAEPHFHYDPGFERLQGGRYLVGGWQSPRYFEQIRDIILDDFSFRGTLSEGAAKIATAITDAACPVAVHVRRGDFVDNPRILSRHGICGRDYYESGMKLIQNAHPECRFFVFSDDIDRVRGEFACFDKLVFVDGNSQEEDLHLMASCRHNIIANSTFSWWAAWLNRHQHKMVVAPRQWFGPEMMVRHNTTDLFPSDWRIV